MPTPNYIPRPDADFTVWALNFVVVLATLAPTLGIDPAVVANLQALNAQWGTDFTANLTAQAAAKAAIQVKKASRAAYESALRQTAQVIQNNPATTDAQRAQLGLTISDVPVSAFGLQPTDIPVVTKVDQTPLMHVVHYRNQGTPTTAARPAGAMGVNVYLKIGGDPPVGKTGTLLVAFDTASPYAYQYAPEHAGHTAYWVLAYTDGDVEGAPGEAFAATITA